jgi:pyruvate-formate lyase
VKGFKVARPREGIGFELAFTAAHRDAAERYSHPAQVELACMRAQYPAILHPVQDGDLIAGRVEFGMVGWGIQDQTVGAGFYYDEERLVGLLEGSAGGPGFRESVNGLLCYWKANSTYNQALRHAPGALREVLPHERWADGPLAASPIIRMAGAFIDFDRLVRLGLPGLRAQVEARLAEASSGGADKDSVFYECLLGALDLVAECARWYKSQVEGQAAVTEDLARRAELEAMAAALGAVTERAPEHLDEAIQLCWLYGVLCPLMEFGRMDVYLGDLYCADIDSGHITEAGALALVQSYFRLVDALDGETDGRVIVGGAGRRNPAQADRFCLVAIEACRTVKEALPQFTLRFDQDTPKAVWDAAMRCVGEGRSYPLLYNDDRLVPDVAAAMGVGLELAEQYMPLGCGEIEIDHHSFGSPNGFVNTLKALELAIRGGEDPMALEPITVQTVPLARCATFEEFYGEFKKHLTRLVEATALYERYLYDFVGSRHPYLLISACYDGCLERGKGILGGGVPYLHGSVELYGNVNVANSLTAIKQLVFEERSVSAEQLVEALDANFAGHERLRRQLLDVPKYGNDFSAVDLMFCDFHDWICSVIAAQAAPAGLASYLGVTINNSLNTDLGRWVGATPDGRKAGTPMANANNPSSGSDRRGVTAMFNSILKPRHDNHDGMVQNMRFTRETWNAGGKAQALVRDYFERGGAQAMITVVGREDLKHAMERPQDWQDLMVRIGGYSARFVTLRKDIQQEIYDRVSY